MEPAAVVKGSRYGKGLFATKKIRKHQRILMFCGPKISYVQAIQKIEEHTGDVLQIAERDDDHAYIDLKEPGRSVNHSCEPNTGIVDDINLTAIRDIEQGEEITFDYSTSMDEDDWEMNCACLSRTCRKKVRDFKHLRPDLQRKYLDLNIVQSFIRKKLQK